MWDNENVSLVWEMLILCDLGNLFWFRFYLYKLDLVVVILEIYRKVVKYCLWLFDKCKLNGEEECGYNFWGEVIFKW